MLQIWQRNAFSLLCDFWWHFKVDFKRKLKNRSGQKVSKRPRTLTIYHKSDKRMVWSRCGSANDVPGHLVSENFLDSVYRHAGELVHLFQTLCTDHVSLVSEDDSPVMWRHQWRHQVDKTRLTVPFSATAERRTRSETDISWLGVVLLNSLCCSSDKT